MSKVRAVRLSPAEEKQVQEFLKRNPIFDFSTLARTALMRFVKQPNMEIKSVNPRKQKSTEVTQ